MQHRELKKEQIEAMRNLCLDQYKSEHDLQIKYHPQLYDLLMNLMTNSHEDHLKKLDQIHDKEVRKFQVKLCFIILDTDGSRGKATLAIFLLLHIGPALLNFTLSVIYEKEK